MACRLGIVLILLWHWVCLFLFQDSKYSIIANKYKSCFRYTILATSTLSTFVKYIFYVSDMLMEGQWERKAVYTFYLELISDLVHLSLYMLFFIAIFL
jgi:E3 ubiquitin-protein ligase synoviolin